jgi:hypothetical protein
MVRDAIVPGWVCVRQGKINSMPVGLGPAAVVTTHVPVILLKKMEFDTLLAEGRPLAAEGASGRCTWSPPEWAHSATPVPTLRARSEFLL